MLSTDQGSPERLTSLGGLVVLEEMAQALGVWKRVDEYLAGPGSGRGYRPSEFVQPLVWRLHAGGRRREDLRELRTEREVLENLGLRAVPDVGTVGDWLRRQGERGVAGLARMNRELIPGALEQEGEELILDVGMEQMPCGQREANALYFAIGVLAYNLAQLLKRRVLPASYRTATLATLRWKVYRLAGKLVRHARGLILQVKVDLEKWRLLQAARVPCMLLRT